VLISNFPLKFYLLFLFRFHWNQGIGKVTADGQPGSFQTRLQSASISAESFLDENSA
jgi:hypothetical protein